VKISDKWKAVVAALGTLAAALTAAAEDGALNFNEAGPILLGAVGVGVAVWAVRNKPAATG
jgi:hypothetical protein